MCENLKVLFKSFERREWDDFEKKGGEEKREISSDIFVRVFCRGWNAYD